MADLQTLLEAKVARERIWAIPGVRKIGFGLKETEGRVASQWAFRVYVDDKKPLGELAAHELIPAEMDGLPTDVLAHHDRRAECTSPLKPGMAITREVPNASDATGTIGCFVTKDGSFHILTCQHVFIPDQPPISGDVYHPRRITVAEVPCNKPIGSVTADLEVPPNAIKEARSLPPPQDKQKVWLDCGLIPLVNNPSFVNELAGSQPLDPHIRDLASELTAPGTAAGALKPAAPVTVSKQGEKTDLTTGVVVEVCAEEKVGGADTILWRLIALPTPGQKYSETYEISPNDPRPIEKIIESFNGQPVTATQPDPTNPRKLHFEGNVFSLPGDSGSIWYDGSRRPVGLHDAGQIFEFKVKGKDGPVKVPNGRGEACHIGHVFKALGLDPATSIVVGVHPTGGAAIAVPGEGRTLPTAPLAQLERELAAAPSGRRLAGAFQDHEAEVRELIHHRRRVTLTWHRHKGQAFVAAGMNAALEGLLALPREIAGYRLADLIRALLPVLESEGGEALRATVEREGPLLVELAEECETAEDVIAHLEQESADAVA